MPYFFLSFKPDRFAVDNNLFESNLAKFYGNNYASLPFRFRLTNFSKEFKSEDIVKDVFPIKVKSGFKFDIPFKISIIDQFFQIVPPLFGNE